MNIVVLAGGISPERNVSLSSGTLICRALRELGHRSVMLDPFFGTAEPVSEALFDRESLCDTTDRVDETAPDLEAVRASRPGDGRSDFGPGVLELCSLADIVFLGLHGQCGEDGRMQAAFDLMGIRYTGSGYLGSAVAMDKDLTKRVVLSAGVRTPAWRYVTVTEETIPALTEETDLPCVVKPSDSGSSIGVSIARTREELKDALHETLRHGSRALLEQYVSGREIQVAVLEDRALPSIEIIPKTGFYDYKNKYQPGAAEEICPAPIPAEVETQLRSAALTVHRLLGLAVYSRTDFILTPSGEFYFLEINTLPGMTPTSLVPQEAAAVGISYTELCQKIIDASLQCRRRN